jgi:hypothetical protein
VLISCLCTSCCESDESAAQATFRRIGSLSSTHPITENTRNSIQSFDDVILFASGYAVISGNMQYVALAKFHLDDVNSVCKCMM